MGMITDEYNDIISDAEKVVALVVTDLFAELQIATPVDTGQLRQAWDLEKVQDGWLISNNLQYASIIFDGRKLVNGKFQGSTQLTEGIDPILDKYNRILEIKLRKI